MPEKRQVDRRIESLRAKAQPVCREWLARCNAMLAQMYPGSEVRITETLRSLARQAALAAQGKSSAPKIGWHNVGLAWDFLIFENGAIVGNGDDPRYAACGAIAAELGCKYPIHLANGQADHDHVEFHPGFTIAQVLAADRAGEDMRA
jgi:hypothetical protein